jgi:ferredoxin
MKTSVKYIIPLVLVSSSVLVYSVIKNQDQKTDITSLKNLSSKNQENQLNQDIKFQKLFVLPQKCLGCGKCVRIDPEHFEMSGRVAIVISSTNLNSSNLTLAINNCPAVAIVLE